MALSGVAIETQTPIKPVLFLDAYERMHYENVFSLNPGRCRIVYLEEIPVQGLSMDDAGILRETVYRQMQEKLLEYKVSWIEPAGKMPISTV